MYVKSIDMFMRFLFGGDSPEARRREGFKETIFIEAYNEVGECVVLEAPSPVRSDLHPRLASPVARNLTFQRYDILHDRT